ncbi:hypothetical protein C7B61_00580 [filamentous cyanobacterium CCP1]|nr:hypothetical protein C7B76_02995 [filamentous cyanobacterium CCP2]PSB68498.1 hypothetical protein C7B61_00580 [filamentous cyanobacterium CCP1]
MMITVMIMTFHRSPSQGDLRAMVTNRYSTNTQMVDPTPDDRLMSSVQAVAEGWAAGTVDTLKGL